MQSYTAHESFWTDVKMMLGMLRKAILAGLLTQMLLLSVLVYDMDRDAYIAGTKVKLSPKIFAKYHANFFGNFDAYQWNIDPQLVPYAKGWPKLPAKIYNQMADYVTGGAYAAQHQELVSSIYISFLGYLASFAYFGIFFYQARAWKDEKFIRGAQMVPLAVLNQRLAEAARQHEFSGLIIAAPAPKNALNLFARARSSNTILPFELESKHILILGTSGSGKGVLVNQLVDQIHCRRQKQKTGERCIFYDLKGEYVAKQMHQGDFIFSPFDSRSLEWNIFNDIETLPDFDVVAKSLFISPDTKDAYWFNCASDVFRTGLVYLKMKGTTSNRDLWEFFSQKLEHIKAAFEQLPIGEQGALKHIDKADSPASASIISILQERIQFFRYLVDLDGDFSFRRYIREQQNAKYQRNLFILNIEQYSTIFKPLMTLCLDMMIRETLSLSDNLNRRIWFVIDELGTLYRMDSIIKLETVGRSKGGCLICANQDLGRIEELYGRANLKSFFNNFNTNFTFRIREPETAEFLSKAIGDQQLIKTSHSRQMSPSDVGDRRSENEQDRTERLIMPVEFQSLQNFEAVINIAGFGVSKIMIPQKFYEERNANFVQREFQALGELQGPVKTAQAVVNPLENV